MASEGRLRLIPGLPEAPCQLLRPLQVLEMRLHRISAVPRPDPGPGSRPRRSERPVASSSSSAARTSWFDVSPACSPSTKSDADAGQEPHVDGHDPVAPVGYLVGLEVVEPGEVGDPAHRRLPVAEDGVHPLLVDRPAEDFVESAGGVQVPLRDLDVDGFEVAVRAGLVQSLGFRERPGGGQHLVEAGEREDHLEQLVPIAQVPEQGQLAHEPGHPGQELDRLE